MAQNVYVLPIETINKMKKYYDQSLTSTPKGAIFRVKNAHAVITAYQSRKVLFQGSNPQIEIKKWISGETEAQQKNKISKKNVQTTFNPPDTLFQSNHIGSDESGTGDYFGPITTSAIYIKQDQIQTLKSLGIQDSKKITDKNIKVLSNELMKLNLPYSLLILPNKKYNTLQEKGWSQGKMKAMLHHHAIHNVLEKIDGAPNQGILIDQFCDPTLYNKYILSEKQTSPKHTYFMTKAEDYSIAVAAASIIARASFLDEMEILSNTLGIPLKKGASKQVDELIAQIINFKGRGTLRSCAKLHFANTKKAEQYL